MGGAKTNGLHGLQRCGQSPWLDNIERGMLRTGALARMVRAGEVTGLTSNPSIFEQAVARGRDYDSDILRLVRAGRSPATIVDTLTVADIRAACDVFRPVYTATRRVDGYVSIEVSPALAHDTARTVQEATRIWRSVKRPNLLVKIPATREGVAAVTTCIARGINVNVTLIFSLERYREVAAAYLDGLARRLDAGAAVDRVASVASFFVSRLDTAVDRLLEERIGTVSGAARTHLEQLRGKAAIANAKLAYEVYQEIFESDRFALFARAGARVQRPLWASTSTKNPNYPDVYYVEALIGPDTVNTLPPSTMAAYKDHGSPEPRIHLALDRAHQVMAQLEHQGISLAAITAQLEREGVAAFAASWQSLHDVVAARREAIVVDQRTHRVPGKARPRIERLVRDMESHEVGSRLTRHDPGLFAGDDVAAQAIAQRLGWLDCPRTMKRELDRLTEFTARVVRDGLTQVVLCGMGGSSLAPATLRALLGVARGHLDLRVIDSTDPDAVRAVSEWSNPNRTLHLIASKSGATTEVQAFFRHFWSRTLAAGARDPGRHFAAITDPDTPLVAQAEEHGFRTVFLNPADVGGRYSALSLFGLVPAALIGADVGKLLDRGRRMLDACAGTVRPALNPGLSLGAFLAGAAQSGRERLTIVTSDRLRPLADWLEQLLAESTGKEGVGLVPIVSPGDLPPAGDAAGRSFVHIRLGSPRAHPLAALARAGHPALELRLHDAYDVAGEFVRWEVATVAASWALGVNPFDEPDVQATKDRTRRLLLQLGRGHQPASADVLHVDHDDFAEALAASLRAPKGRRYGALLCFFAPTSGRERTLSDLRSRLASRLKLPVTVGFGPRYLHSTGQLHKGGANSVLPIVLTADVHDDLPIPGTSYTFGMLERAQADGDTEALRAAGRPAIRVHLGASVERGLRRLAAALDARATASPPPARGR